MTDELGTPVACYEVSTANGGLRCGEILTGVVQIRLDVKALREGKLVVEWVTHPTAIVVSQDCDLDWDYAARQANEGEARLLPTVLFCGLTTYVELIAPVRGSDIKKRIRQNQDERYQVLSPVPAECDATAVGLPSLGIDFKNYFTVSTDELYERIYLGQIQRRTRLVTPYAEQFSTRFAHFLGRVAIPEPHRYE